MHADACSVALAAIRKASDRALESLGRGLYSGAFILQNHGLQLPRGCMRCGWATCETEGFALAASSYDLGINEAAERCPIECRQKESGILLYIVRVWRVQGVA